MKTFKNIEIKYKCHWDKERTCERELLCRTCEYQPDDDDKPNGKNPPLKLRWQPNFNYATGNIDPGAGWPECPACGEMPYSTERCTFCGQRFIQDERVEEYNEPESEERMDCFICGGKGTLVGSRAKSNRHFHGICTACGATFME